jgi:Resolvase, N terminal domain
VDETGCFLVASEAGARVLASRFRRPTSPLHQYNQSLLTSATRSHSAWLCAIPVADHPAFLEYVGEMRCARVADTGLHVLAQTGLSFDLATASGKLMRTIMAGLSEFERDLIRERVKSGLAAARARGAKLAARWGSARATRRWARCSTSSARACRIGSSPATWACRRRQ